MKRLTGSVLVAAALWLTACRDATDPLSEDRGPSDAEIAAAELGIVVPDQFIVVFNDDVEDPPELAAEFAAAYGGQILFTYRTAIKGFAVRIPEPLADVLSEDPRVAYVEPDRQVQLFDTQLDPPSWGLDRVDQEDLPLDDSFTFNNDGSGADIYILDTGVRRSHNDFGGRVEFIPNGSEGDFVGDGNGSAEDCHGHGTHVAGTAAGAAHGIAKGASVWAGRVVNCDGGGEVSMAIAGVDWITENASTPAVVNMSLGYGNVQSLRDAVEASVAAGFNYSVAAGNGFLGLFPLDACNESPAGAPNAITVGATESDDDEASFSNYGTCVDILAPGVGITSAWNGNDDDTETISGTSMATLHVTGTVALYLTENPTHTPVQVVEALTANATPDRIVHHARSDRFGTPNLLLNLTFIGEGGEPPPNESPTASFTFDCTDLTCDFDASGSSDSDGTVQSWDWDFGDGDLGSGELASHTYGAAGTFTVTLTVTDDDDATGSTSQDVTVTEPGENSPPTASFTVTCTDLSCDFDGSGSSDSDGTVDSWDWEFGDGDVGSGETVSHGYSEGGTFTVTLTVTDDDGAAATATQDVTVTEPPPPPPPPPSDISLTVTPLTFSTFGYTELSWSGATTNNVDVYRDGALRFTTANDGFHRDIIGRDVSGSFTYQVCEEGTSVCSNEAVAEF